MARTAAHVLIGLILFASAAHGEVHEVLQEGNSFVPADITVAPGDTIRWTWTSGSHTVTTGSSCVPDGIFDEPLTSSSPVAELTIPVDFTGAIPYFCIPHCVAGMVGTITVEDGESHPSDINGDGEVDLDDLVEIILSLGPCPDCPADLDGSGNVDIFDLALFFVQIGPCPPGCDLDFNADGVVDLADLRILVNMFGGS